MRRTQHHDVMLSSTSRDLPDYRKKVSDAVLRASCYPLMMELDTAMNTDAVGYSLGLVDDAEVYVGIFAHRYGYTPPGAHISITEMEYRRARENDIACLIFLIDDTYTIPVTPETKDIYFEPDPVNAAKLTALKAELMRDHVVGFFTDPENLAYQVFEAITKLRDSGYFQEEEPPAEDDPRAGKLPEPPEPYIAHPYVLTRRFFGRSDELAKIDAWAQSQDPVLVFQAIGGMGKSALTWHWLGERAPDFDGVVWWSFYESDGSFENFVKHALAYVTDKPPEAYHNTPREERRRLLLDALGYKHYLLVLDGLERALAAYHKINAPMLSDAEVEAERAAAGDDAPLRSCTDPRHGEFLRALAGQSASKVLVSTRLMPHDLEDRHTKKPLPGVSRILLTGLYPPAEALGLLRHLGVRGDGDAILRFTMQFGNHALLLNVVAGLVLNHRPAPGDFDAWFADEGREMGIADLDLTQRRTHILNTALNALTPEQRRLLGTVAAFRYPVGYGVLRALNPYATDADNAAPASPKDAARLLNAALDALEDTGLLQWDRTHNRYDLHPVVRAYAYDRLTDDERRAAHLGARDYFDAQPPEDPAQVEEVDDLRRSLEIYHALLGAGELDLGASFYRSALNHVLLYEIGAYEITLELLRPLFPAGFTVPPALATARDRSYFLNEVAIALGYLGRDDEALAAKGTNLGIALEARDGTNLCTGLNNYGLSLYDKQRLSEAVRADELAARLARALGDSDQIAGTEFYLMANAVSRGDWGAAQDAYARFQANPPERHFQAQQFRAWVARRYAKMMIIRGEAAAERLDDAEQLVRAARDRLELGLVAGWRGEDAMNRGEFAAAKRHFQDALAIYRKTGSRAIYVLFGRLALVCAHLGERQDAQSWLQQALTRRDDRGVLVSAAETYLVLGETDRAREYALKGYAVAWADGPPYSFWWEQQRSWGVLQALGETDEAAIQRQLGLTPYDPAQVEKIPYEDEIIAFIEELEAGRE